MSQTHGVTGPEKSTVTSTVTGRPLGDEELSRLHAWWRAANYLSVGQIYLMGNPLLREPLLPEHVKPRLLGCRDPAQRSSPPSRSPDVPRCRDRRACAAWRSPARSSSR